MGRCENEVITIIIIARRMNARNNRALLLLFLAVVEDLKKEIGTRARERNSLVFVPPSGQASVRTIV